MKAFLVACCGCGRVMNLDGSTGAALLVDGLLNVGLLGIDPSALDQAASFDTKKEADTAAAGFNWSVADDEGPNHRCPPCAERQQQRAAYSQERRGAYISTAELRGPQ